MIHESLSITSNHRHFCALQDQPENVLGLFVIEADRKLNVISGVQFLDIIFDAVSL